MPRRARAGRARPPGPRVAGRAWRARGRGRRRCGGLMSAAQSTPVSRAGPPRTARPASRAPNPAGCPWRDTEPRAARRGRAAPADPRHRRRVALLGPVMDRLAAERDVVAIDMPGFGASPPLATGLPPGARALAEAVAEFVRAEVSAGPIDVGGHSL